MKPLYLLLLLATPAMAVEPKVGRDIPYAEPKNERQMLNVYAPPNAKNLPVLFWIHGGGWQRGDKSEVDHKPQAFVDRGYVFVATNYRFVPKVTIKEMAADVASALHWVHDHIDEYGGDPKTIVVAGHSAGAQLAALVSTDERYLKREGLPLSLIKACVPVDGDTYDVPLQIDTVEQRRKDIYAWKFGAPDEQKDLSPVTHVTKGKDIPPVLILHVADHPETKMQSLRLAKALNDAGYSAKTYGEEGTDHVALNANLGKPDDKPTKMLFDFLAEVLKKH
jgi:acetyl esterase/lipase